MIKQVIGFISVLISVLITNSLFSSPSSMGAGGMAMVIMYPVVFLPIMVFFTYGSLSIYDYFFNENSDIEDTKSSGKYTYTSETQIITKKKGKSFFKIVRNTFAYSVGVMAIMLLLIWGLFFGLNQKHKRSEEKKIEKTYHTIYKTEDFNDDTINFYRNELESSSEEFIEAKDTYNIFKADVKREMALGCIRLIRIDYKALKSNSIDPQAKNFKKNARNKYANSENLIEKSMKNEEFIKNKNRLGTYSYVHSGGYGTYHLQTILPKRCENKLPVNEMYEKFIPFYINGKKAQQMQYKSKEYVELHHKWLKILDKKYPESTPNRMKNY